MKYLLTGCDGQLGYAFHKILEEREDIKLYPLNKDTLDITDLTKARKITAEINPDVIINCAAYNAVDRAEDDRETACMVNGIGPRNLAIICNERDIPLVHYSTDYVFDGEKGTPYTIADIPNPINEYGKSKLLGERFVQNLCSKYLLIRTSWVFGPGGRPGSDFVDKVLEWAQNNDRLKIVDDQISSPTYTFDLAGATLKLLEARAWGLYHITGGGTCSRYEWAKYILNAIKWKGTVERAKSCDFDTAARRPAMSMMDNFPLCKTPSRTSPWQEATSKFLTGRQ